MVHKRNRSEQITKMLKKWEENPIVEDLGLEEKPNLTNIEHIKKLQEILVQTCIDYINKHNLTDIYLVSFKADDLNTSAKEGKWTASTDSSIRIDGIINHNFKRKNGEIYQMSERYEIGSYF